MNQLVDRVTQTQRTADSTAVQTNKDTDNARHEQGQAEKVELVQVLFQCHSSMWIEVEEEE